MKRPNFPTAVTAIATLVLLIHCAKNVAAQEPPAPATPATAKAAPSEPTVQLSSAVEDVLKLYRAKISDDITVAFIQNSGRHFSLTANEIIYLRKEGVSDRALAAMLNQQLHLAAALPTTPQSAAPAPSPTRSASAPQYDAGYTVPPPVYQTAPSYAPASTVYVTPDYAPYYYTSYPYYYGYSYPGFSLALGYGVYYGGYYCGNSYKGGYYHGGGYPANGWNNGNHYRGGSPGGTWNGGSSQARSYPISRSAGSSYRGGGGFSGATHASFSGGISHSGGGGGGRRR